MAFKDVKIDSFTVGDRDITIVMEGRHFRASRKKFERMMENRQRNQEALLQNIATYLQLAGVSIDNSQALNAAFATKRFKI